VDVLGADGTVETITGTTIHPIWSVDRQEWVPLSELADCERLQGLDGLAVVLSVTLSRVTQPVYNIEVHGEHVYQVGELGVVVHNACPTTGQIHHAISTKIARALGNHPVMAGMFSKRDPRFITQAINNAAHRGYQRWHRELDAEVVKWIEGNPTKNADDFLGFLKGLYDRADINARFPNGF